MHLLLYEQAWWHALEAYREAATAGRDRRAGEARAEALRALVASGHPDPWSAVADVLLYGGGRHWKGGRPPEGVQSALRHDLAEAVRTLSATEAARKEDAGRPRLADLAAPPSEEVADLAKRLRCEQHDAVLERALRFRRERGGGPLGRWRALRWSGDAIEGIARPARIDLARLEGLDRPLQRLVANTEAFLDGRPAQHALLYGPRGSGKSTAVRGLLSRFGERGLRLVELASAALADLPRVLEPLEGRPERFVLFVDDLTFEAGDARYQPLKSLLEGSLAERPENVRLYATSNRRHLVQERLRERPDPIDDDVHAWDTQHERLALADRFGLLLTFPGAGQRRYLEIVRHLLRHEGLAPSEGEVDGAKGTEDDLLQRAVRFAEHGNGYSGRTAQQFVEQLSAGLA